MTTIKRIETFVSERRQIPKADMHSTQRTDPIAHARQEVWWITKKLTKRTLTQIGSFHKRDHTTIRHGLAAVEKRMDDCCDYRETMEGLLHDARAQALPEFFRSGGVKPFTFRTIRNKETVGR